MKRLLLSVIAVLTVTLSIDAKTLVVYYSYTNNVHTIVTDLLTQIDADVVRVEPAEKGLDYAANGYAIGSAQISAIRNNPNSASSYPAIDPVTVDLSEYDMIIVAAPLWWSNMAAPLQSFLFGYGPQIAGKKIALIVSSSSSGISGVVSDAKRLIPEGNFLEPNLWIRSSQVSRCHALNSGWLADIGYDNIISGISSAGSNEEAKVSITAGGISVDGNFDNLSVYDMSGRLVVSTQSGYMPHAFAQGCYVAKLTHRGQVYTTKIVVR